MPYRKFGRLALAAAALALTTGCAALRPAKPRIIGCDDAPHRTVKREDGSETGIFWCYGERGEVYYAVHALPPAPPAPLTADQVLAHKKLKAAAQ